MGKKLGKSAFPQDHTTNDFKCFGPIATVDCEFHNNMMADLGCFSQETIDSNKYYHAAVVQSTKNNQYYAYFEWGRTGATKPQFQFVECSSQADAQREYASQLAEKNTKRGQWDTVGGIKMFRPRAGKDLYVVRQLAKRSHGLADAKNVTSGDAVVIKPTSDGKDAKGKKKTTKKTFRCDTESTKLMRDLLGGTISYARSSIEGNTIPTQPAIDEGRQLLTAAKNRLSHAGAKVEDQVKDKELRNITYALYSRIPKKKPLHSPEKDWILSQDNILMWEQDLDAFETALQTNETEVSVDDPFANIPADMEWVNPKSELGIWLYSWWPNATRNNHHYLGNMKIKNLWKVDRRDTAIFENEMNKITDKLHNKAIMERSWSTPKVRQDLTTEQLDKYWRANVGMLFHGSRSVNIAGIITKGVLLPKNLTAGIVITGRMYGDGKYWAFDWKKSAGYTSLRSSYWSNGGGAVKGRSAFMFVADVTMGQPYVAPSSGGYQEPPKGFDSVLGKAGKSGVQNDELITYHQEKDRLKYLVEFDV